MAAYIEHGVEGGRSGICIQGFLSFVPHLPRVSFVNGSTPDEDVDPRPSLISPHCVISCAASSSVFPTSALRGKADLGLQAAPPAFPSVDGISASLPDPPVHCFSHGILRASVHSTNAFSCPRRNFR